MKPDARSRGGGGELGLHVERPGYIAEPRESGPEPHPVDDRGINAGPQLGSIAEIGQAGQTDPAVLAFGVRETAQAKLLRERRRSMQILHDRPGHLDRAAIAQSLGQSRTAIVLPGGRALAAG